MVNHWNSGLLHVKSLCVALWHMHFSAGFTLDTYAHVTTAAQKEAAKTMGKVLANAL